MPQRKIQGEGKKKIDHKRLAESILHVAETTGFVNQQELFETLRKYEDFETSRKGNFKSLGFWDFLKAYKKVETRLKKKEEPNLVEKSEASKKAPRSRVTGVGQGARRKDSDVVEQRDLTKVKKPLLKQKKKGSGASKRRARKLQGKAVGAGKHLASKGAHLGPGTSVGLPEAAKPKVAEVVAPENSETAAMEL